MCDKFLIQSKFTYVLLYSFAHSFFAYIICNFHRTRNLAYGHEVVSWENTVTNICLHSISFYVHCLYWYYYYSIESPSGDIKFGGKVQYGVVQCHCLLYHSLYGTVKFTATYLKCVSSLDFSLRAAWAGHWLIGRPKQL